MIYTSHSSDTFYRYFNVQARRKQLRVGPAKIRLSAEGTSTLGGSGEHAPPGEFLI